MPVISTNIAANSAVNYLNTNAAAENDALAKLSSGSKIVKASDDAAGLAISTRISSDITTLQQASTNSAQAVAVLNTADGAAGNISDILARMKSLASESSSGTTVSSSRAYIDAEFQNLITEIGNISSGTRYGGQSLLNGTTFTGVSVLVGSSGSDTISLSLSSLTASSLGVNALAVLTQTGATAALSSLDTAIDTVSKARAQIGAQEIDVQLQQRGDQYADPEPAIGQLGHQGRRCRRRAGDAVVGASDGLGRGVRRSCGEQFDAIAAQAVRLIDEEPGRHRCRPGVS